MGRREILAVVGAGFVAASTSVYLILPSSSVPSVPEFEEGRTQFVASSQVKTVSAPGRDGPATITKLIIEGWSWEVPKKIIAGQSATISVRCQIKEETTTRAGPVDAEFEKTTVLVPEAVPEPRTLEIQGAFWKEPMTQTTPAGIRILLSGVGSLRLRKNLRWCLFKLHSQLR
jgi:hypothetical protein